jgi:hypothetical protein
MKTSFTRDRNQIAGAIAGRGADLVAENFVETALSVLRILPDIVVDSQTWSEEHKRTLEDLIGQAVWLMSGTGFLRVWAAREQQILLALGTSPDQVTEAHLERQFSDCMADLIRDFAESIDELEQIRRGAVGA